MLLGSMCSVRLQVREPGRQNPERGTSNREPDMNTNREVSTEKGER
jgi:hypothetical protein